MRLKTWVRIFDHRDSQPQIQLLIRLRSPKKGQLYAPKRGNKTPPLRKQKSLTRGDLPSSSVENSCTATVSEKNTRERTLLAPPD